MTQLKVAAQSSSVARGERSFGPVAAAVVLLVSLAGVVLQAGFTVAAQDPQSGTRNKAIPASEGAGKRPDPPPQKLLTNQASKRNAGSAGILSGSVCLYNLFVDDKESSWSAEERISVRGRVAAAVDFISLHARKYKVRVDMFSQYRDGLKYEPGLPTDMFANPAWTEAVLKLTGAASGNDLVATLKKKHRAEHVLFLIHVNKRATSYSLSFYDTTDSTYAAERVVCFDRYRDGRPVAAATYAHEILHGFGAGELYFPFDGNERRKQIARMFFPDDVMYRVDYNLGRLNVGAYTAFRIGWLDSLNTQHRVFED